ncbi:MAG: hydrolase [Desulfuromonas sp.]|nr:MAG: hydrolase [Desulfuromonas sp.]
MSLHISRQQALKLLQQHVRQPNMLKHCLASEAVLRRLARHFGEDEELWGLSGLLHDLDVETTGDDLSRHTHETVRVLREMDFPQEMVEAIRLHNEKAHPDKRRTRLHHALAASETITGLIVATALVYPDKKLASVKVKSVRKRIKEKSFAAGANRDIIRECELIDLPLDQFCALALESMQEIAPELGL